MKWIFTLALLIGFTLNTLAQRSELGLLASPVNFDRLPDLGVMYKMALGQETKLRAYASFQMDLDKEIRFDSTDLQEGLVAYQLAVGFQRDFSRTDNTDFGLYFATDLYWNSMFQRKAHETYYGYYYDFGVYPAIGLLYQAGRRVQLTLESRANLNFNLQEYSAEGENFDRRFTFSPLDHFAVGLNYTLGLE